MNDVFFYVHILFFYTTCLFNGFGAKGQLISKCLYGQKSNENIVRTSALNFLVASLGLLGSFFGLHAVFLINDIMYLLTESQRNHNNLPGSPRDAKKFQGRNPYNIFVAILVEMMTPKDTFQNQLTFSIEMFLNLGIMSNHDCMVVILIKLGFGFIIVLVDKGGKLQQGSNSKV